MREVRGVVAQERRADRGFSKDVLETLCCISLNLRHCAPPLSPVITASSDVKKNLDTNRNRQIWSYPFKIYSAINFSDGKNMVP